MIVTFQKNSVTKQVKQGFSWTTLFFGGINQMLFRGEFLIGLMVLIGTLITGGLVQVVYAFFANKVTARRLMERGWVPLSAEAPTINAAIVKWSS